MVLIIVCAFIHTILINDVSAYDDIPLRRLNDGHLMPSFGLGTWLGLDKLGHLMKVTNNDMEKAVGWAIDAGYRHIDTAFIYDTEGMVGQAVHNKVVTGVVNREDMFITTKLWNDVHARDAVVPALKKSLSALSMKYVDLFLIHFPIGKFDNGTFDSTDYVETWRGMIEAKRLGLAKSIGVSNFNEFMMMRIMANTGIRPAVLQAEVNLNIQQPSLRAMCRKYGIAMMAYTPFGSLFYEKMLPDAPPPRVDDPTLVRIASKYNKTVPQIALRYLVELGVVPIPKSVTKSRIEENIDVFDFRLSQYERNVLRNYDVNYRTGKMWSDSPYFLTRPL